MDGGLTWQNDVGQGSGSILRKIIFGAHEGGRFIAAGDGRMMYSNDVAKTWKAPKQFSSECTYMLGSEGGIAYGNGTFVMVGGNGYACHSTDGGDRWTREKIPAAIRGDLIWTGSEFRAYTNGRFFRSSDGKTWTSQATTPNNILPGFMAISDAGTFVGIHRENQTDHFYRSEDGVAWTRLPATAHGTGPRIWRVVFGYAEPSASCKRAE